MKHFYKLIPLLIIVLFAACTSHHNNGTGSNKGYQTVANDPLKTRIYTLDNGLKVYMCVNKETPRIQTYIAVKTGSKNDPHETTGMAHYFEHLMFKGTEHFGTQDYEAEKVLLDTIENLFEVYRSKTDPAERAAIYHQIDSISYEASKIAIPNEYDKLMSAIGSNGTNAWTSDDETVYTEEIPCNQIDNWAKIQADRFKHMVFRGFHTELETIYEEYNMSLTSDNNKVYEEMMKSLYPHHPYGMQTTLGKGEHLKNPSITNLKKYRAAYYVPNNVAICLSGDFDPDMMIKTIKKYFGDWEANPNVPVLKYPAEEPITQPIVKDIYGLEADFVTLSWRAGGARTEDAIILDLIGPILSNDKAGLLDVDIVQPQKALSVGAYGYTLSDYGLVEMYGEPKAGQSLEEVKDLLLAEMAKLRAGDFDESLLEATIANAKLNMQRFLDSNRGRAMAYVQSFIDGVDWQDYVNRIDKMSKITKQDIIDYANKNLNDNNYVLIYKRQGDPKVESIEKPAITPIVTNRDVSSAFLQEITNSTVTPIQPVFIDFKKDMDILTTDKGISVLYKENETTDIFRLIYLFEIGTNNNPALEVAFDYLEYLGTDSMSLEQINSEFYKIACDFRLQCNDNRCYITLSGLSENMPKAMELIEDLLANAVPDEEALFNLKDDLLKARHDSKLNQRANFMALGNYAKYGPEYVKNTTLTDRQIKILTSQQLLGYIHDLTNMEHRILYYGPLAKDEVVNEINQYHHTPDMMTKAPEKIIYEELSTPTDRVLLAEYDANQIYYTQVSNLNEKYNVNRQPIIQLYNEYFGGAMNSIVFQEMREARSLAYSASANVRAPRNLVQDYNYSAFIATQNDKMTAAIDAFQEIINNMPQSQAAFDLAKTGILSNFETQRTIKENVLWSYINAQDLGLDYDTRKVSYNAIKDMTLDDVVKFQQETIKDRKYTYYILGRIKDLDMDKLNSIAKPEVLTQEQYFGY